MVQLPLKRPQWVGHELAACWARCGIREACRAGVCGMCTSAAEDTPWRSLCILNGMACTVETPKQVHCRCQEEGALAFVSQECSHELNRGLPPSGSPHPQLDTRGGGIAPGRSLLLRESVHPQPFCRPFASQVLKQKPLRPRFLCNL